MDRTARLFLHAALACCASLMPQRARGADDGPAARPATPVRPDAGGRLPVPAEVVDALKSLKSPAEPVRQKAYKVIDEQGDARLIPAMKAFADGTLQLRDGRLVMYGPPRDSPDGTKQYPLLDAVTLEPAAGPDGRPMADAKIDLSAAFKKPLTAGARENVTKLVATLSLLSPDPAARVSSIRDAGDRAARAFIDPANGTRFLAALSVANASLKAHLTEKPAAAEADLVRAAMAAVEAAKNDRPTKLTDPVPGDAATRAVSVAFTNLQAAIKKPAAATPAAAISAAAPPTTAPAAVGAPSSGAAPAASPAPAAADSKFGEVIGVAVTAATTYRGALDDQKKKLDELPRYAAALRRQSEKGADPRFAPALREAGAGMDVVLGDQPTRIAAVRALGEIATSRADNLLRKTVDAARLLGDRELIAAAEPALAAAGSYQGKVRFVKHTFDGLSSGSILVLLALGLSIIFGLMGVINMAHGEFMMIGAFTTLVVSEWFKARAPGYFDYYPIAAVPAAFLVAGAVGLLVENLVVRHLYGRPLETLLATWGIGLVLIQLVRVAFGDNVSVAPPSWMTGSVEVVPDLNLGLNRIYIVCYAVMCIVVVYFLVNRTKLGLLLRATTQNREMAAALGVTTRHVDAATFGLGAGLAGLAGVAVPMYDKINPSMGNDYVVESFMVVVVGGVGKLAGVIWAGMGLGFLRKYLEPALQYIPAFDSSASVISRVIVLGLIVAFLQWRPAGLFPPKGRLADA